MSLKDCAKRLFKNKLGIIKASVKRTLDCVDTIR